MVKKSFLLIILTSFIFLACGCTVIKGTGGAAVGCVQGSVEGFKDDMSFIKKADNWTKDNLW